MKVIPLGGYVVLRQIDETVAGGFQLAEEGVEKPCIGEVLAIGARGLFDGEWYDCPEEVEVGVKVAYQKYGIFETTLNLTDKYVLAPFNKLIAKVEEWKKFYLVKMLKTKS